MTEAEFVDRAQRFLLDAGGLDPALVGPDVDLVEAGVLDSLLLVAFLAFIEEQRGAELEVGPDDVRLVTTLRSAYALV